MIYLASPYTHTKLDIMQQRFERVTECAASMIHAGHIIYSPIIHFHPIAERHNLPRDFAFWEIINKEILLRCDQLWVLTLSGWRESQGVMAERTIAAGANIPMKEVNPATWLL